LVRFGGLSFLKPTLRTISLAGGHHGEQAMLEIPGLCRPRLGLAGTGHSPWSEDPVEA
jgi:hypothetical protein